MEYVVLGQEYYDFSFSSYEDLRLVWALRTVNLNRVLHLFESMKDFNARTEVDTYASMDTITIDGHYVRLLFFMSFLPLCTTTGLHLRQGMLMNGFLTSMIFALLPHKTLALCSLSNYTSV